MEERVNSHHVIHTVENTLGQGVPENYDEAFISCMTTLPDPNNFLSAYR